MPCARYDEGSVIGTKAQPLAFADLQALRQKLSDSGFVFAPPSLREVPKDSGRYALHVVFTEALKPFQRRMLPTVLDEIETLTYCTQPSVMPAR